MAMSIVHTTILWPHRICEKRQNLTTLTATSEAETAESQMGKK